jgi:glucuronate isomerase
MGLTENTATALLALNSLDICPDSAVSVEDAELSIIPDHYVFRMLYSQGVPMEDLGVPTVDGTPVETDHRRVWQRFCENFHLFRAIPSRHDVWRRITCDWLAGMVLTNIVDEEEAPDMAREFAYGLAKRAYGFQREPVGKT